MLRKFCLVFLFALAGLCVGWEVGELSRAHTLIAGMFLLGDLMVMCFFATQLYGNSIYRRVIDRLTYIDDDPESPWRRRWRRKFDIHFVDRSLNLVYQHCIIQLDGEPIEPFSVVFVQLSFDFDIRNWRIQQSHFYYDGPHCSYQFGPFFFFEDWRWCKKCIDDQLPDYHTSAGPFPYLIFGLGASLLAIVAAIFFLARQ